MAIAVLALAAPRAAAQDIADVNAADSAAKESAADSAAIKKPMANTTAGEFTPGKGFQLFTRQARQPEHQRLRPLPLGRSDAGHPDVHRPSRPRANACRR